MRLILFRNYPKGYTTIFIVKLLGNFSTYGLRSILILFLTSELPFVDAKAFGVYGTFMAISNLMSIFGGWFTDKMLGIRQSVLFGGYLIFFGFMLLCLSCEVACLSGLSFISVGTGLFKPSTLSALTAIIPEKKRIQNNFYTTLYSGINLGNLLSLLMCGWISQIYGWKTLFIIIGMTMFIGSSIFYKTFTRNASLHYPIKLKKWQFPIVYGMISINIICVFFILFYQAQIRWLIPLLTLISLGSLGHIFVSSTNKEKRNILCIWLIMIISAVFYILLGQTGSSITLFIERGINRTFFGSWTIPTLFFRALNPISVIILGPVITGFWNLCANKGTPIKLFSKFSIGFLFMSLSFSILGLSIHNVNENLVSPFYILFVFLFQVLGELCTIPIGLESVSNLAPKRFSTTIVGILMVAYSFGNYMAAILANFFDISQYNESYYNFASYQRLFICAALFSLTVCFIIIAGVNLLKIFKRRKNLQIT